MTNCRKCGQPEDQHTRLNGTTSVCPSGTFEPEVSIVHLKIGNGEGGYRQVSGDEYKIAHELRNELAKRDHFIATVSRNRID